MISIRSLSLILTTFRTTAISKAEENSYWYFENCSVDHTLERGLRRWSLSTDDKQATKRSCQMKLRNVKNESLKMLKLRWKMSRNIKTISFNLSQPWIGCYLQVRCSFAVAVKSLHWRWHFQDTAVQIKTFWRSVFVQNMCLVAGGPNYNDSPTKPEIKDKKISLSVSCHWIWRWHMQTVGTTFASCNTYRSYPTAIMFVIARSMSFKLVLHPLPHTKTVSTISRLACTCSSDSVKCVRISERWRHHFYDDTTLKDEHFF